MTADFDEELGMSIANEWLLAQMTAKEPLTAADLFTKLHQAVREESP
jgi:hypothetical protein